MRMYVIPVCLAMVWQLVVIIGFLAVCIIGLDTERTPAALARAVITTGTIASQV